MATIDTIIFDLDGTLADASRDIAAATNYVLNEIGWPELPLETVTSYIGGGAEALWRKVLGQQAETLLPSVLPPFLERYNIYYCVETCLYPGTLELLEKLQGIGIKMGIATQKVEKITFGILDQLGIRQFFPVVVGPESVKNRKPHPESLLLILDKLHSQAGGTWMIGDTPADILAGKAAGTYTCGVTYGYGRIEDLLAVHPDKMIDQLDEVLSLLA